jgi:Fe2+ or Zn2+ uptake regulation protein
MAAASLAGQKTSAVGVFIWYMAGLKKTKQRLKICAKPMQAYGLSAKSVYRGIARLEEAGLISVERHRGRCPLVTILEQGED